MFGKEDTKFSKLLNKKVMKITIMPRRGKKILVLQRTKITHWNGQNFIRESLRIFA
jgi:hypothetical protein